MPAPQFHPHPDNSEITCKTCKFWHPKYINNYSIDPISGQSMPTAEAMKKGLSAGRILTRASMCFRNPTWVLQVENMYCGFFRDANSKPEIQGFEAKRLD